MHHFHPALILLAIVSTAWAGNACFSTEKPDPSPDTIRAVVRQSIPLLEQGMAGSADQRKCFTCHHQAIPVMTLAEVKKRGLAIDEGKFKRQIEHTAAHLVRGRKDYLAGRGQGGKVISAGYALWTLEMGGHEQDATTDSVVHFLLSYQKEADHWKHRGHRPPSSGSDFTATYVALRGLATFGNAQQKPIIKARTQQVTEWLLQATPQNTEDRVFRLWGLTYVATGDHTLQEATSELIDSQKEDGGWAQTASMESDAYATGTVLVALLRAANIPVTHPSVTRGAQYLISSQLNDGTWHVKTRAKPFQTYYESRFPHGKDQFISIAASSWATLALAHLLPEINSTVNQPH